MSWESLPRRVFLDSCVLQLLSTYGEFVYDGGSLSPTDRIYQMPDGFRGLSALRSLAIIARHASFDWIASSGSIREAAGKADAFHFSWVVEMVTYARSRPDAQGQRPSAIPVASRRQHGYLSHGDRGLIEEAFALSCDGFLTTDRRLAKNAGHLQHTTGIRLLSPLEYWEELEPWAALFV